MSTLKIQDLPSGVRWTLGNYTFVYNPSEYTTSTEAVQNNAALAVGTFNSNPTIFQTVGNFKTVIYDHHTTISAIYNLPMANPISMYTWPASSAQRNTVAFSGGVVKEWDTNFATLVQSFSITPTGGGVNAVPNCIVYDGAGYWIICTNSSGTVATMYHLNSSGVNIAQAANTLSPEILAANSMTYNSGIYFMTKSGQVYKMNPGVFTYSYVASAPDADSSFTQLLYKGFTCDNNGYYWVFSTKNNTWQYVDISQDPWRVIGGFSYIKRLATDTYTMPNAVTMQSMSFHQGGTAMHFLMQNGYVYRADINLGAIHLEFIKRNISSGIVTMRNQFGVTANVAIEGLTVVRKAGVYDARYELTMRARFV